MQAHRGQLIIASKWSMGRCELCCSWYWDACGYSNGIACDPGGSMASRAKATHQPLSQFRAERQRYRYVDKVGLTDMQC